MALKIINVQTRHLKDFFFFNKWHLKGNCLYIANNHQKAGKFTLANSFKKRSTENLSDAVLQIEQSNWERIN